MTGSSSGNFNKFFSGGLGKGSQLAAWVVAFGVVGGYKYFENKDNGEIFSKNEQESWNKAKKGTDNKSTK